VITPQRIRGERAGLWRGVVTAPGGDVVDLTAWPAGTPSWLGSSPRLRLAEADIAADACDDRPAVLRLSLTLVGDGHAVRAHVDRDLRRAFATGNVVWVGIDRRGGVGLSVVTGERLVCAAGAVMAVPLADVSARYAPDLWTPPVLWLDTPEREAERIRSEATVCVPLEVRHADGRPLRSGDVAEGDVMLFVQAGLRVSRPVTSLPVAQADWVDAYGSQPECVALARVGPSPVLAAKTSAMLLAVDGFTPVD
jgi:hypothetical protein